MQKILIVGAGASGVYLSVLLKQKLYDCDVIVLEQNTAPLKKVLATGNGRCNLSNKDMSIDYYQSDNNQLVEEIISSFDMVQAMNDLGLYCIYQGNLLYPKSEQALSVKQILMQRAEELGVLFLYGQEVLKIEKGYPYIVKTNQQQLKADYVIFAMGSEAGRLSGTQLSRYQILRKLHLNVVEPRPALTQFFYSTCFKVTKRGKSERNIYFIRKR